jgi:hypothetical protein
MRRQEKMRDLFSSAAAQTFSGEFSRCAVTGSSIETRVFAHKQEGICFREPAQRRAQHELKIEEQQEALASKRSAKPDAGNPETPALNAYEVQNDGELRKSENADHDFLVARELNAHLITYFDVIHDFSTS